MILQKAIPMNARGIFYATKDHLLEQNEAAFLEHMNNTCAYHIEEGGKLLACAIGFRIPNALYKEEFEERNVIDLVDAEIELQFLRPTDMDVEEGNIFLEALQSLHDRVDVENWPKAFAILENWWFPNEHSIPDMWSLPLEFSHLLKDRAVDA